MSSSVKINNKFCIINSDMPKYVADPGLCGGFVLTQGLLYLGKDGQLVARDIEARVFGSEADIRGWAEALVAMRAMGDFKADVYVKSGERVRGSFVVSA